MISNGTWLKRKSSGNLKKFAPPQKKQSPKSYYFLHVSGHFKTFFSKKYLCGISQNASIFMCQFLRDNFFAPPKVSQFIFAPYLLPWPQVINNVRYLSTHYLIYWIGDIFLLLANWGIVDLFWRVGDYLFSEKCQHVFRGLLKNLQLNLGVSAKKCQQFEILNPPDFTQTYYSQAP